MSTGPTTTFTANPPVNRTLAHQAKLPKLPIPPLEETCRRYLTSLVGLQDSREHAKTQAAVEDFLKNDGPRLQERLVEWAKTKDRYVLCSTPDVHLSHIVLLAILRTFGT
jgi:carnitine O-acetyltransferase